MIDLPQDFELRQLTVEDVPAAADLREMVGWGRASDDFRQIILWGGAGSFGITHHGQLVATSTTIHYGQVRGWIGMVIVHPEYQRRGLGRCITQAAVDYLRDQSVHDIMLGATELGRPVYEKMGFRPLHLMKSWIGAAPPQNSDLCRPMTADDLPGVITLDTAAFGADRTQVLWDYFRSFPHLAWCDDDGDQVMGFALMYPNAAGVSIIGPWIHQTPEGAERLLRTALHALTGQKVRLNIPDYQQAAAQMAAAVGLEQRITTTRMILGSENPLTDVFTKEYGTALAAIG